MRKRVDPGCAGGGWFSFRRLLKRRGPAPSRPLRVEELEDRRLLTILVSTLVDETDGDFSDGDLSLREALELAAEAPGADVIEFDPGLAGGVIQLDAALGQLVVDSDVDIQGPGAEQLTVDAERRSRVFFVVEGVTAALHGLTITGGDTDGQPDVFDVHGGGVHNAGDLTITSAVIIDNHAMKVFRFTEDTRFQGSGGGVHNTGLLTIADSTIADNRSFDFRQHQGGGGVYNAAGEVRLTNVILSDNQAAVGGGVFNDGALTVVGSTFERNFAREDDDFAYGSQGGGVYNLGTADILDSRFTRNASDEGPGGGGSAIYNEGAMTLGVAMIIDNEGDDGQGAVFNSGVLVITGSTIAENSSDNGGGGVYNLGQLEIHGSIISANETGDFGGGVYNAGNALIANTTITENSQPNRGGGVYNVGTLEMVDVTLSENTARLMGAGLFNAEGGVAIVRSTTVSANRAFQTGGGGVWNDGELTLLNSTVTGNIAFHVQINLNAVGGGLANQGSLTAVNVTIVGNTAEKQAGLLNDGGTAVLHNSIVADNRNTGEVETQAAPLVVQEDVSGDFDPASSHNLIGAIDGSTGLDGEGALFGTRNAPLDPRLGPLRDNGGATLTHAIWPGSPAVDAGANQPADDAGLSHDQRGFDRFLDGDADGAFTVDIGAYEFEIDRILPTTTVVEASDIVRFGEKSKTFQLEFRDNLAIDVSSLDDFDVRVLGPGGYDEPARRVAIDIARDGSPRVVTYKIPSRGVTWDASDNGAYEIAVLADAVADLAGNFAAAGLVGQFQVTIDPVIPAPVPLAPEEPLGGLIHTRIVSGGIFSPATLVNRFTIDVDAGQTLSAAVEADAALRASLVLLDPTGTPMANAAALAPGAGVVLSPTAIDVAGTYTIELTGAFDTFGAAAVRLVLNAAVEAEAFDGPDNNSLISAEDLEDSFIPLVAGAERGAVLGELDSSDDWYRFTLDDGQSASLVLTGETLGGLSLELYDAAGTRLAQGVARGNVDQAINQFVDATQDGGATEYFARVAGAALKQYSLVALKNASFDLEPNTASGAAQELGGVRVVLGHVGRPTERDDPFGPAPRDDSFRPDRLIVRFAETASAAARAGALAAAGARLVRELPIINGALVEIDALSSFAFSTLEASVFVLEQHAAVCYAEPDYQVRAFDTVPNDPRFSELWGMQNTGQTGGAARADIDAPAAWDIFTGSSDVVVASIDTGVDYTHEDLAANMWINPGEIPGDGIDNDGNGYIDDVYGIDTAGQDSDPRDDNGHGTHTAGTMGAVGDNGLGVAGVNWNVRIMALKFLDSTGSGFISDAVTLVEYMTMMKTVYGVNLVASNNSWGGGGFSQAMRDAIQASIDVGIMFVAAAGNSAVDNDRSSFFPANYDLDGLISVAASDHNDMRADFSNIGAASVDLAAPGVDILSTLPGNDYDLFSGTSMAAPHVAGAVALLSAFKPRATLEDIKAALLEGVDPLPAFAHTTVSGGRLNLTGALRRLDDLGDWYQISVAAGDLLNIETATPGDGLLQPLNLLNPALEIYDPTGALVAMDDDSAPDGRNARITHQAELAGVYRVLVHGEIDRGGEYILSVAGASGPAAPFSAQAPGPLVHDLRDASLAARVTIHFNDQLLLSSLDAADLTVDGAAATNVTIVDGSTVEFELPDTLREGANQVAIAAGALVDLQGAPLEAFAATLWGLRDELVVSTLADEEDGDLAPGEFSLREALAVSAAFSGGHVIRFDDSLRGGTIELTTGALRIDQDVDLHGLGADELTIDAGGRSRVALVAPRTTVAIDGLTLTGGATFSDGGAMINHGDLTITNARFVGNEVILGFGGALLNFADRSPATLTLHNVDFLDNQAGDGMLLRGDGAAIYSQASFAAATVTVIDSMMSNHLSTGAVVTSNGLLAPASLVLRNVVISENMAGGVSNTFGDVTLDQVTISENENGGVDSHGGELVIDDSTISGNGGSGVSNRFGVARISRSTISGNASSPFAGGVSNLSGEMTLANVVLSENGGVGVYNGAGRLTLSNSTISGNVGAGLKNGGTAEVSDVVIRDNGGRGGLYHTGGETTFTRGVISGNDVGVSAEGRAYLSSAITLDGVEISDNADDGVVVFNDAAAALRNVVIANNGADGVRINRASLTLQDSVVSGNRSDRRHAAGVTNYDGFATLRNVTITENQTGFYSQRGESTLERVTISNNQGSGVLSKRGATTITDSVITNNTAEDDGGGVSTQLFNRLTIVRTTIASNFAPNDGAGVYAETSGPVTIIDSTISGNTAGRIGGGVRNITSDLMVMNTTISGNSALSTGGGWSNLARDQLTTLVNVTLSDNTSAENRGFDNQDGDLVIRNSIIEHLAGAPPRVSSHNLIGGNPRLGPLADNGGPTRTHALLAGSPAIDAGEADFVPSTPFDQRGAPFARVFGGRVDIGAFELQPPPRRLAGDTNGDGSVDLIDLNNVRNNFGAQGEADGSLAGDAFPFNGAVDLADLNAVRNNFGAMPPSLAPAVALSSAPPRMAVRMAADVATVSQAVTTASTTSVSASAPLQSPRGSDEPTIVASVASDPLAPTLSPRPASQHVPLKPMAVDAVFTPSAASDRRESSSTIDGLGFRAARGGRPRPASVNAADVVCSVWDEDSPFFGG